MRIPVRLACALLVALWTPCIAAAQTPAPLPKAGALLVTGQTGLGAAGSPAGAGIEWLRPSSEQVTHELGAFTGASTSGWFTYGRLGAIVQRSPLTLAGFVDAGGSHENGRGYPYTRIHTLVATPVRGSRLVGDVEFDFFHLQGQVLNALRVGGTAQVTDQISLRAGVHAIGSGGNLDAAGSLRADYSIGRWGVLGGVFVSSRDTPARAPIELTPALYTSRSQYVGFQIRTGRRDVITVVDVSKRYQGRVATLLVALRAPLR